MSLQVIGVGLHRTGTLSIKVALERLGFGPCYHGFEYAGRRDQAQLWKDALDRDGDVDWELIFGDYRAAMDWPMIYFWDKVVAAHPDAKVLLTERDPETWFDSHFEGIQSIFQRQEAGAMPTDPQLTDLLLNVMFAKFSDRPFERDHAIKVFNQHYAQVRDTVPSERLLVYRAADGWGPLCRFLDVEVPDEPFPRINSRAVFADNAYEANVRTQLRTDGMTWL